MKKLLQIAVLLVLVLAMCACSAESPKSVELPQEAAPAVSPTSCDGFGELSWGDSYDGIVGPNVEILDRYASFGGHNCYALYTFDENGKLTTGSYEFNPNGTLLTEWSEAIELYFDLRNTLIETYGRPAEMDGDTIYTVAKAGEGSCLDAWPELTDENGQWVDIQLQLLADGRVNMVFITK